MLTILLQLLLVLQQRQENLVSCIELLHLFCFQKTRAEKKRDKRLHRKLRSIFKIKKISKTKRKAQITRESYNILDEDIFDKTGLFENHFEFIFQQMEAALQEPRTGKLIVKRLFSPRLRLLLVLQYLRENLKFKTLANIYGTSPATIQREIRFTLPIIYACLPVQINWPQFQAANTFYNCVGAIDCTPHLRTRIHPGSIDYYRGDLKDYFITAQLTVGLSGQIWRVDFRMGHHNDPGIFNSTSIGDILLKLKQTLLGDLAYHHSNVKTPRDMKTDGESYRHRQLRAIVERVFGYVKCWAFASGRCRLVPELQEIGLMIIYQLVALITDEFPLISPHQLVS
jgi:hypothetical protein